MGIQGVAGDYFLSPKWERIKVRGIINPFGHPHPGPLPSRERVYHF
jgi:hypothetical protein